MFDSIPIPEDLEQPEDSEGLDQDDSPQGLPVDHPDFRYRPSRNPYAQKLKDLPLLAYTDHEGEPHRGNWRSRFSDVLHSENLRVVPQGSRRELHVEIGCNGGHVILEWARQNPQNAWIGIDWKFKQIHRGADKAHQRKIENLIFLRGSAERMHYWFSPGEIDHLYLFFPDPWEKNSQKKNRFFQVERLRRLAELVRVGGDFYIKTDHAGYFDWMKKCVREVGDLWEVSLQTEDLHQGREDRFRLKIPEVTIFEKVFIDRNQPIFAMRLVRKNTGPNHLR